MDRAAAKPTVSGRTDASGVPTLSQFQQYVANHQVGYLIVQDNQGGGPGAFGGKQHTDINNWVAATFTPTKVGPDTVYDLTAPTG